MDDFNLPVYQIRFEAEATTMLHMGPQAGAQIRATLWHALNRFACTDVTGRDDLRHAQNCPMCFLLELQARSPRGENPPRPFAIRPPLGVRAEDDRIYGLGERFEIGMTLFGDVVTLFPYIVQGMRIAGEQGVGYGRGRFILVDIVNVHPLSGEAASLMNGRVIKLPQIAIRASDVEAFAANLPDDRLRLRFLTPTQIKDAGRILTRPAFAPLISRILERCQSIAYHYSETDTSEDTWKPRFTRLKLLAEAVKVQQNNTRHVMVRSGSRRTNQIHDIGGIVGDVLFIGDMKPFKTWLVWGMSLQVGKNTIKGAGWYEIAVG